MAVYLAVMRLPIIHHLRGFATKKIAPNDSRSLDIPHVCFQCFWRVAVLIILAIDVITRS